MAETNVHVFYQHDSDDYAIHVDGRERLHVDHLPHKVLAIYSALVYHAVPLKDGVWGEILAFARITALVKMTLI